MDEQNQPSRRTRLYQALVVVCALAVRLSYLAAIEQSPTYDVRFLKGTDNYDYFVSALRIAQGDLVGQGTFNFSPLYQYFLAVIFFLFGGGNLLIPRFIQLALGAVTALLAFHLGRGLKGDRAGLLAGLITAFYGPLFFYEAAFLRDALLALLYTGLVLAMAGARRRPGFARGLFAGALFMLCYLGKPNITIMVLIVPWWLMEARAVPPAGMLSGFRGLIAGTIIGAAVMMTPLALRNQAAGVPLLSTTQRGALEFIAGNHPSVSPAGWNLSPEVLALERESQGRLSTAVLLTLKLYRDHPLDLVKRQLEKTWLFLGGYEIPNNQSYYVEKRSVRLVAGPWLTWPFVISGGLVGLWLLRRKWRENGELYAYTILFGIGAIAFYLIDRFRLPLVPALAAFSGAAVIELRERFRARPWLSAAGPAGVALLIMIAVWPRVPDPLTANDYHNLVRYHLMKNEVAAARSWSEEGMAKAREIAAKNDDADSHYRLAQLYFLAGKPLTEVAAELTKTGADPPAWIRTSTAEMNRAIEARKQNGDPQVQGFRL